MPLALVLCLVIGSAGWLLARDPVPGRAVMETGTNVIGGVKIFTNGVVNFTGTTVLGLNTGLDSNTVNALIAAGTSLNASNWLGWASASNWLHTAFLSINGTATVAQTALAGWPTNWSGGSITSAVANATTATVWTAEASKAATGTVITVTGNGNSGSVTVGTGGTITLGSDASKLSTNFNGSWLVGSGGSTNITGGGTWTLSSGVWTYAPTGITTEVQSALDGKLGTNGVAQSSVTASNVAPLLDWVATNNTTTVLNWAWPANVTGIVITASAISYSSAVNGDTFVASPTPAGAVTNGFRIREIFSNGTTPSYSYATASTGFGLSNAANTNEFASSYRHHATATLRRTTEGFTGLIIAHRIGNNATNYNKEVMSLTWFGGATTNLAFSLLTGANFASNSWIRIMRE